MSALVYGGYLSLVFVAAIALHRVTTDEGFSYYQVNARSFGGLLASFESAVNTLPYAYFVVLWLVDRAIGVDLVSMRLVSVVFGVAAVVLFHRLLARRFGAAVAFAACVSALLLSPEFVRHVPNGRPYTLYVLAGIFALHAGLALVEGRAAAPEGRVSARRALILNAAAAFALPSVHYVGLVFSLSALVALLVVHRPRGKALIATVGSFAAGWLAFTIVHVSQLRLFARGGLPFRAGWIPRLAPGELVEAAAALITVSPVVSIVLLVSVAFALWGAQRPASDPPDPGARRGHTFLFVVAALWLALPPAFYLLASLGGPNLSLPRYFLPSQLAVGVMAALVLSMLRFRHAAAVMVVASLALLVYPTLAAARRIASAPTLVWQPTREPRCLASERGPLPCITNDPAVFVRHAYHRDAVHRGSVPPMFLLRRTDAEARFFRRLDRRMHALSTTELARLPGFRFLHQPGNVNSFNEFDIHAWAPANGYRVVEGGKQGNIPMYDATRD